jgi:ABC transporter substrate binding protein
MSLSLTLASTSRTDAANHWLPRAVGIPRSLRALAIARSEAAPVACSSAITGARSAARAAAASALASAPFWRAFAVSFAPGRKPPSFLPRRLAAASAALMRSEIKPASRPWRLSRRTKTRASATDAKMVNDPVDQGLIASLAHPGGNITGLSFVDFPLFGKSLELLRQIAPKVARVGLMFRPTGHPYYDEYLKAFALDKQVLRTVLTRAAVTSAAEIESEVVMLAAPPSGGLIVAPDTFTVAHRQTAAWRPRRPFLSLSGSRRRPDGLCDDRDRARGLFHRLRARRAIGDCDIRCKPYQLSCVLR